MGLTGKQGVQLALVHLPAEGRYAVDEHTSVQMVELMLHDACQIALGPLVVFHELFVHIADVHPREI